MNLFHLWLASRLMELIMIIQVDLGGLLYDLLQAGHVPDHADSFPTACGRVIQARHATSRAG